MQGEQGKVFEVDDRIAVEIPRGHVREEKRSNRHIKTDEEIVQPNLTGPHLLGAIIDDKPVAGDRGLVGEGLVLK